MASKWNCYRTLAAYLAESLHLYSNDIDGHEVKMLRKSVDMLGFVCHGLQLLTHLRMQLLTQLRMQLLTQLLAAHS